MGGGGGRADRSGSGLLLGRRGCAGIDGADESDEPDPGAGGGDGPVLWTGGLEYRRGVAPFRRRLQFHSSAGAGARRARRSAAGRVAVLDSAGASAARGAIGGAIRAGNRTLLEGLFLNHGLSGIAAKDETGLE